MFAGFIATAATQPLEVVRTKIQVQDNNLNKCTGAYKNLVMIWSQEGLAGLSRGIAPRLMRKPLSNALTFTLFEIFKKNHSRKL